MSSMFQRTNVSSRYLSHKISCVVLIANHSMNRFARMGERGDPMTAPSASNFMNTVTFTHVQLIKFTFCFDIPFAVRLKNVTEISQIVEMMKPMYEFKASTSLYMTLHYSTMVVTSLYFTLHSCTMALLYSTLLYHGCSSLYITI